MKNYKIAAGIVTYNPDVDLLIQNIKAIYDQVEKVYIVDNASHNISIIERHLNNYFSQNVNLIKENKNLGIAKALNELCSIALEEDYTYIITLDQDSISPLNLINELEKNTNDDVAIIAPNIIYKNNEKYCQMSMKKIEEVDWVITSASLTNLKVWKNIDGFDEKLFIDGVDKDFCLRAKMNGYRILKDYNVSLIHELGNLKCKKILKRIIYVTNHSALRKYYMVRNGIYLDKKLGLRESKKIIIKNLLKTILYEDNKMKKIKLIFKGIFDGKKLKKDIKTER